MENKIILPNPYNKVFEKMDDWNKLGLNKLSGFKGSIISINLFYIYLFHKYKSKCFLHLLTFQTPIIYRQFYKLYQLYR
jgi:hypothetical protein